MTPSQLHILQYQTVDATTRGCIIMLQICTISDRRPAAESKSLVVVAFQTTRFSSPLKYQNKYATLEGTEGSLRMLVFTNFG